MKILALCDSPTLPTGFARVAQNLFKRWHAAGHVVDVWGIAFMGWKYKEFPYVNQFFPGGGGGEWCRPENLTLFLAQVRVGGYTHVWIMQDTFLLSPNGFPNALREVCAKHGVVSCLYFPVDAPLDPEWVRIVKAVDIPVAYTEYGREAAILNDLEGLLDCEHVQILPHGVDTEVYRPRQQDQARLNIRFSQGVDQPVVDWLKPGDFLMLNVNQNQRRKDPARSLEILAALLDRGIPAKLLMHMQESYNGLSLEKAASQLGLELGVDWLHNDGFFRGSMGSHTEEQLVQLYQTADLYLTTTLGEGWGLGITEALACGLPVALPMHTACKEIGRQLGIMGMGDRVVPLLVEEHGLWLEHDNSRRRTRVDMVDAADEIACYYGSQKWKERPPLNPAVKEWLSWDRIAHEFLKLMSEVKK